jgi:hypothetical protein
MNVEAQARLLVDEAGLPSDAAVIGDASDYLRRTKRGRRYGLIAGLVLGIGPLAGNDQLNLVLPRMLAGYLLGLLASELLAPRPGRPPRRAAALRARQAGDLVPAWARIAPWIVLVPVLAAPLLVRIRPAAGTERTVTASYSCSATNPGWPGLPVLVTAAVIAVAGLAVAELTLRALARRARPADNLVTARLDDVVRGMSARAVVGGATALGLTLLGTIGQAVANDAERMVCPLRPVISMSSQLSAAYPWAAQLTPWLQVASDIALVSALITLAVCRRRQDPRRRPAAGHAP